jgi:ribulose 1,5-bisphosphate synthetase/thiazole synthase
LTEKHVKRSLSAVEEEYDYIVVGGGTSGLVVANRLTENPESMCALLAWPYAQMESLNTMGADMPH